MSHRREAGCTHARFVPSRGPGGRPAPALPDAAGRSRCPATWRSRAGARGQHVGGGMVSSQLRITDGEGGVALASPGGRDGRGPGRTGPGSPRGSSPSGWKEVKPCGPRFLLGRRMLVVGDVEQVHGPAGQEPAVLPALGHAPHHRGNPAAPPQGCPASSLPFPPPGPAPRPGWPRWPGASWRLIFNSRRCIVVQWLPGRHRCPSYIHTLPLVPPMTSPVFACVESPPDA